MTHVGLAMTLKPGCYDEYKRRHDELWPELAERMTSCGIDMVIYRHGDLLFVHGTAPSPEAWSQLSDDPITPKWNTHMAEVLETGDDGEIVFHELPLAFDFGKFKM